jgi:rhodanese-related sulfurtransferase
MTGGKMIHKYKLLFSIVGISMLSACGNDEGVKTVNLSDFERISQAATKAEDRVAVQQLAEWIVESRQDYQLIDIRDDKSYQDGHIKGATNMTLTMLMTPGSIEELSHEQKVIVYSNGSENAAKAVVMLRLLGLDSYLLSGGYNAWQQHVLNPDISLQASDDEAPQVAIQRAIACYFNGSSAQAPVQRIKPVDKPKAAFKPPVFAPPADSGGLIVDEGC